MTNLLSLLDTWISRGKPLFFLASLLPLLKLLILGYMDDLGANPIEKALRNLGFWSLTFLSMTMAVTPLRRITHLNSLIRLRRLLGLYAFFYASLHMLTYLVLDQFFDWRMILKDVLEHPYITIGLAGFILMTPLALTSTDTMIRKLGGRRWRLLHRWIYVITLASVIHFWWLVKKDITQPLIFAVILLISLALRLHHRYRSVPAAA